MELRDYNWWKYFKENNKDSLKSLDFKKICHLHSKYNKHSYFEPCTCNPATIKQWIKDLDNLFLSV